MSQAGIISRTVGPVPPFVPTSFTTDYNAAFGSPGVSIPAANIENVVGSFSAINNDNGIATRANPDNGNNLLVLLTNRVFGVGTTVGASTITLITVPLGAVPASYRFQVEVVGRETTTGDSIGYTVFGSVKTDGVTGTIIETPYTDVDQDASLVTASIAFVTSGNNGLLQVTGVVGTTIAYKAVGTYLVV